MPDLVLDYHRKKIPIDHPDGSVTYAKLGNIPPKLFMRVESGGGFVYVDYLDGVPHVVIVLHTTTTSGVVEVFLPFRYSPPATIEWTAKLSAKLANVDQWPLGLEDGPGFRNGIAFRQRYTTNQIDITTCSNGTCTSTNTTAYDPTVKHKYRVEWTSTGVNYYIDGNLVATLTTNVPTVPMTPFSEYGNSSGSALNNVYPFYTFGGIIT